MGVGRLLTQYQQTPSVSELGANRRFPASKSLHFTRMPRLSFYLRTAIVTISVKLRGLDCGKHDSRGSCGRYRVVLWVVRLNKL